ncbi:biogenesis of lysosome-related organelles complex 1 subunit 4-like [Oppia nitens]|uniref:biogenesis of lysosome-related organelles complex 1 subunit 4-like n=1 Tax=Oppia nitens TaxID=1686743 RepID=UPI0023DBA836|nr:biogenesis of lysosome-related organelles complex 1 subunit 4-like [Oppia nitens]
MNTQNEDYEDINIDSKDESKNDEIDGEDDDIVDAQEDVTEDDDELQAMAQQLSIDYANYFRFDITCEKKETEDAIEDLLTHLEEFCGLIDMIRNDNNICLEEVVNKITEKSKIMDEVYSKIDRLEQFVEIVKKCVDDMDTELTKAEQLFGDNNNNNRVKKFFNSFIGNTSKQNDFKRLDVSYEPKEIFRTDDYIKSCDFEAVPQSDGQSSSRSSNTNNGSIKSAIV